jgi:anti-sigma regulatory factor (Ser/Thr protein kinase)
MIAIATERNLDNGVTTVRLDGDLTPAAVPPIRSAVGKVAAECPTAVIIELSGLHCGPAHLMSVFPAASRQAQQSWGVPVLLCAGGRDVAHGLTPFRTFVPHYDDHRQASLAVRAHVPRWLREHFPPVPANASRARALVGEACLSWGLPHLREGARLICSELAANAIVHAGTEFDITVAYSGRYLRIAAQDGSTARPRLIEEPHPSSPVGPPSSGRGMRIVAIAATHWGVTGLPDGKIVWALLSAHGDQADHQ